MLSNDSPHKTNTTMNFLQKSCDGVSAGLWPLSVLANSGSSFKANPRKPGREDPGSAPVAWRAAAGWVRLVRRFVLIAMVLAGTATGRAQMYYWQSFVGRPGGIGNADGTGTNARFFGPQGVAVDAGGNVYVADTSNHTVRKIASDGTVTTLAGTPGVPGAVDALISTSVRFNHPWGVSADANGNVYVADCTNNDIRKIRNSGVVITVAGTPGLAGDVDAVGADARFNAPYGVAADNNGNVFVADYNNHTIRQMASDGTVTTLAGTPGVSGTADGTGTNAQFNGPSAVAVDGSGNVYVTDYFNCTIRKVTSSGTVTTVAGIPGAWGSVDGPAATARFNYPQGIAVDAYNNVYVADTSNRTIRRVGANGIVTTLAGRPGISGYVDGTGTNARFLFPTGAAVDSSGNCYVADANTIRMIASDGTVTTLAGSPSFDDAADGIGMDAHFSAPRGVAVDGGGNVYVADYANNLIRKATPAGVVTVFAGSYSSGTSNGVGSRAQFDCPQSVTVDGSNNLYVADTFNSTIRAITPAGTVTTLAGIPGSIGCVNGPGASALFYRPGGVAADSSGDLFVADTFNSVIRKMMLGGTVATLAGFPNATGAINATGTSARFNYPGGVAVDGSGNTYVADTSNCTIRKITSSGTVSLLAGSPGVSGTVNGTGTSARFNYPQGLAVDRYSNVYVVDNLSHTIRKVTSAGVVTTIGGQPGVASSADGIGSVALFSYPFGIAVDASGNLYVADNSNNRISKGMLIGAGAAPTAIEGESTATTFNGTTLTGTVFSNALSTKVYFNYGPTTAYGLSSGTQTVTASLGLAVIELPITGLDPTAMYHFQMVAVNSSGTNVGVDQTFTTAVQPVASATTGAATGIAYQQGTLNAAVNPNGLSTKVYFSYGTSQFYGTTTGTQQIGSGTTTVAVVAPIANLNPDTTYHFQVVAVNAGGVAFGGDQTFTTVGTSIGAEAVAVTGDLAPGIDGAWFTSFRGSSIDNSGAAGFWAGWNGGEALCVDSGSTVSVVAQTGAMAPGVPTTFAAFGDVVYRNPNLLAFVGALNIGGAVTPSTNTGVWLDANGALTPVVRTGGQAPGCPAGAKFASFTRLVLPDSGGPVFLAKLVHKGGRVSTANDTGIWGVNSAGHLKMLLRKGSNLKVGGVYKQVTALNAFSASAPATGDRGFNSAGTIVAVAAFADGTQAVLKVARSGSVSVATARGSAAPGIRGARFTTFGNATIDNSGRVALRAQLAGSGVKASNNSGIWVLPSRAPVARIGSAAPGIPGRVLFKTLGDPVLNNRGQVAFLATLASKAVGIWANTSGALTLVACAQSQAPYPVGAVFSAFQRLALPDQGGPVILASLAIGPGGVTALNNVGIWQADSNGALSLIAQTGDSIELEGAIKIIAGLGIFDSTAEAAAQPGGCNTGGALIFRATFTDGSQALITAAVRSP